MGLRGEREGGRGRLYEMAFGLGNSERGFWGGFVRVGRSGKRGGMGEGIGGGMRGGRLIEGGLNF